jgi:hypothetical protein
LFEFRGELEKEISPVSAQVSKAVAAKEFKKADELQAGVDKMIELRKISHPWSSFENNPFQSERNGSGNCRKKFQLSMSLNLNIEKVRRG